MTSLIPAVLREEPQFRRLFAGMSLSAFGDRVTFVALPFAVLSIGGGAGGVGVVAAAAAIPFVLFTLIGGVVADRVRRHRLMLVTDLVRLVTQSIAAYLLISGRAEVWHLAVLFAIFGTADAFFSPAVTGLLPLTVAPLHLQAAGGLRSLVMSTGMVAGPAVAGILIAVAGAGYALAVDAVTFAASAASLATLQPRSPTPADDVATPDFLRELREGFSEIRSRTWVWSELIGIAVYHVVVLPAIYVLGPVLAEQELDGASSWALITAAFGLGSIAGDLVVIRLRLSRPLLVGTCALVIASCQAIIYRQRPSGRGHRRPGGRHGRGRLDVLHAVGVVAPAAHSPAGAVPRLQLRLHGLRRADAGRSRAGRSRQRRVRPARHAVRHDRRRRPCGPGAGGAAGGAGAACSGGRGRRTAA